jgi:hypothetical protein
MILVPGSRDRLALRKHVMCAKNLGVHVWCSTLEYQKYEKLGQEIGFQCSQERHQETCTQRVPENTRIRK